ncbi:MAG: EamA family transporter [Methanoregulaceae archaeon]|nr:EamA family transporter [Methanoregulaceae archaeon]
MVTGPSFTSEISICAPNTPVSAVAPIDKLSFVLAVILGVVALHEKVTANVWIGCGLIAAGVLVTLR